MVILGLQKEIGKSRIKISNTPILYENPKTQ